MYFPLTVSTLEYFHLQPWSAWNTAAGPSWSKEESSRRHKVSWAPAPPTSLHRWCLTVSVIPSDLKWSRWRCLRVTPQPQMTGGGRSQKITSCPSFLWMVEKYRLSCRPSRPPTSSPQGPATPVYSPGCRVCTCSEVHLSMNWWRGSDEDVLSTTSSSKTAFD